MKEQDPNFRYIEAPGDARDILARLYREIGISAVAAALQATHPSPSTSRPKRPNARCRAASTDARPKAWGGQILAPNHP